MKANVIDLIKKHKVISIVRGVNRNDIIKLCGALYDGGIKLVEVTFNQKSKTCISDTCEAINAICKEFGEKICVGAGTVLSAEQCEAAYNAGAKYMISPNFDVKVVKKANELGAVSIPGVLTPTEAVNAHNCGADFIKLFPAGDLGLGYIKSLCAPLNHINFLAVGGINDENLAAFLKTGIYGVGVGSNIVNTKLIAENKFDEIKILARKYTTQIDMGDGNA